jgi:acyl-coenzyme A synthetase/AMP-(fatty) acid ligase
METVPAIVAPEQVVATGRRGVWTQRQLMRDVAVVARQLPTPGPAEELLLNCQDRYVFSVGLLAAWEAGFAVALPPNRRPRTLQALLDQSHVRAHLHDVDLESGVALRRLMQATIEVGDPQPVSLAADRHVATVHTSGSTGEHRAERKTAGQLFGEARMLVDTFGIGPDVRILATVPAHHIYGLLFGVLVPFTAGAAFVCEMPLHAETVAATVREHEVDVLVSTPAHLWGLEVLDPGTLSGLRLLFSSGARLHQDTADMLRERFRISATEVLGSTETGGIAWRRNDGAMEPIAWHPFAGVHVDVGADGRLLLDSPFLASDAEVPMPCEDLVELREDGTFLHLGRLDDVVKIAGKRLALGELERRLLALPGVEDAAVVVEPSRDGRAQRVRAVAVAPESDSETLHHALQQWFDPVTLPRKIVLVDALPRDETGKLTRDRVLELLDVVRSMTTTPRNLEFSNHRRLREEEGTSISAHHVEVRVPEDLFYFKGHFPGHPVLPGVAQLERIVLYQVGMLWPDLGQPRRVERVKFRRPIEPGDVLSLHLDHEVEQRRVSYSIRRNDEICASGVMLFVAVD